MKKKEHPSDLSLASALRYFLRGNLVFVTSGMLIYLLDTPTRVFPPLFQQVYTDNVITHKNPEWFGPLLMLYTLLFVFVLVIWVVCAAASERPSMLRSSSAGPGSPS